MASKCPNCGNKIYFSPDLGALCCDACGGIYMPEEMEAEEVEAASVPETVKQGKANTSPKGSTRATEEASVPDDAFKGFLREVRYFLEDMGAFLKAALPYLAAAAVLLLAVVLSLRKRGKKT